MPSLNSFVISAAGGGKTTRIVREAIGQNPQRCALLTYTQNNTQEIKRKLYTLNSSIPPHIEVWSWFSFLLRELARPYQKTLHTSRIGGICWIKGRSTLGVRHTDIRRFYFSSTGTIYSDKLSRFICECNAASGGLVVKRLEQRFDGIYIDEIQDMAAYDLELIELMLRSRIKITLVGDHRQATFRTNDAAKNSAYSGSGIKIKLQDWDRRKLGTLTYEQKTYRCQQAISDLADRFFPNEPPTVSCNAVRTGHDGVFAVRTKDVNNYMMQYAPQVLRLDKKTNCHGFDATNFGESKGLTFDRVLIFPHKKGMEWLTSGKFSHVANSAEKLYVGITRARHSVAFAVDDDVRVPGIQQYY